MLQTLREHGIKTYMIINVTGHGLPRMQLGLGDQNPSKYSHNAVSNLAGLLLSFRGLASVS